MVAFSVYNFMRRERERERERGSHLVTRGWFPDVSLLLPPSLPSQAWKMLELELFKHEVPIPVYFVWEDEELLELYEILTTTAKRDKQSSVTSRRCRAVQGSTV